jgi:hypothetical protein
VPQLRRARHPARRRNAGSPLTADARDPVRSGKPRHWPGRRPAVPDDWEPDGRQAVRQRSLTSPPFVVREASVDRHGFKAVRAASRTFASASWAKRSSILISGEAALAVVPGAPRSCRNRSAAKAPRRQVGWPIAFTRLAGRHKLLLILTPSPLPYGARYGQWAVPRIDRGALRKPQRRGPEVETPGPPRVRKGETG